MRQIKINLYEFDELGEEAKQKAVENLYDINVTTDWWLSTYEDAENIGLKITGFDLDRRRHATGDFELAANEVAANIFKEHDEHCKTYKTAQAFMEEWQPVFDAYMDETNERYESRGAEEELQSMEDEFLKSLLEDYAIILQNESEYLMTEKAIIETIEANDYEFTENEELH